MIKEHKRQSFHFLQIAYRAGYINVNWKRVENDMDKISKKVKKQVKRIEQNDDFEKGIVALANKVKFNFIIVILNR